MARSTSASVCLARWRASSRSAVTSKPSDLARVTSWGDFVAPHAVQPAALAARSTEPPINPSPSTHRSGTGVILPAEGGRGCAGAVAVEVLGLGEVHPEVVVP